MYTKKTLITFHWNNEILFQQITAKLASLLFSYHFVVLFLEPILIFLVKTLQKTVHNFIHWTFFYHWNFKRCKQFSSGVSYILQGGSLMEMASWFVVIQNNDL